MREVIIDNDDPAEIQRINNSIRIKPRKEGEKLLRASASHGTKSETWIFLPETNEWYNVGNAQSKRESNNMRRLLFTPYNLEGFQLATHYDVHTKEAEMRTCNGLTNPSEKRREIFGHLAAVENAIPSMNYLHVYAMSAHYNAPAKYDFRIVHPHGMTLFEFKRVNLERAFDLYEKLYDMHAFTANLIKTFTENKSVNDSIEEIVSYMNEGMFGYTNLKFFPNKGDFSDEENKAYGLKPNPN